jgi:hypothetical protein
VAMKFTDAESDGASTIVGTTYCRMFAKGLSRSAMNPIAAPHTRPTDRGFRANIASRYRALDQENAKRKPSAVTPGRKEGTRAARVQRHCLDACTIRNSRRRERGLAAV